MLQILKTLYLKMLLPCLLCSIVLVLIADHGFPQVPIPDDIKKTVIFLFASDGKDASVGTGFYVVREDKKTYLVTAKHVLQTKSGLYWPRICMRVNTEKGAFLFPIQLSGSNSARVFVHEDPDIDIAVVPGADIRVLSTQIVGKYNVSRLSVSLLATKEHFQKGYVKEGDEVFFTGWFRNYYGAAKNYPIVRFGRLAMVPNEKIPWGSKMLDLYLIEAHSSFGNSGSPVFFRPSLQREPGTFITGRPTLLLAGILKGYFKEPSGENTGIAAVVPAFQLDDILDSDEGSSVVEAPPFDPQAFADCIQLEDVVRKILLGPRPRKK